MAWADDNRTLLYVEKDPVTLLGRRVRAHVLGTPVAADRLVYEEPDESFDLVVMRSKSERHLYIGSESTTTSEWRYARADDPSLTLRSGRAARGGSRISDRTSRRALADPHATGRRRIFASSRCRSPRAAIARAGAMWCRTTPRCSCNRFEVFRDFLAVNERSGGLLQHPRAALERRRAVLSRRGRSHVHDACSARIPSSTPPRCATSTRRSRRRRRPTTTTSRSGERQLLKREPVLGDFDPANYTSEFLWAPARDGERVPVSIVYRKDTPLDGTAPLYQYAYGSYGLSIDPVFSSARLSLLDRGFVYAIAHVRGGQERGRRWYDAGRLGRKWNTFNDFIDVTDFLVARGYGARDRVFAAGGSAGGLLVGVDRQRRAGALSRAGRARAVRRHRHDHARRIDSADDARIRGMGQSARARSTTNTCSRIRRTTMSARRPIRRCW